MTELMNLGYDVLVSDMDIVVFANPFDFIAGDSNPLYRRRLCWEYDMARFGAIFQISSMCYFCYEIIILGPIFGYRGS